VLGLGEVHVSEHSIPLWKETLGAGRVGAVAGGGPRAWCYSCSVGAPAPQPSLGEPGKGCSRYRDEPSVKEVEGTPWPAKRGSQALSCPCVLCSALEGCKAGRILRGAGWRGSGGGGNAANTGNFPEV